jgi:NAD(P)-dependent dehydrogenase (short-subunit alcohol dehydrogenase family)
MRLPLKTLLGAAGIYAAVRGARRSGSRLVLVARDSNALERACAELAAQGAHVRGLSCDVSEPADVRAMIERANLGAHFT